ncbi:MAG: 50S ribosome-binding GTPase [Pirellulaceae bacterium]|nr:50S ribosome-binding GTPase [Pirellulaceae bacterium]
MPANLTQQYHKAEQAYRRATTPQEELDCLQLMLKELPKHKGTDKMQADLKQKISRVKQEASKPQKSIGKKGFRLQRHGAGRAVIVGGPNAGKSQLLAALTNATPEIAEYPFSTREPQPGIMPWEDVVVQLVDTPPITADVFAPEIQALIRGAELVLFMLNLGDDEGGQEMQEAFQQIQNTRSRMGPETCVDEEDIGLTYTQTILVINKVDLPESSDRLEFFRDYLDFDFPILEISAQEPRGLEPLRNAIYEAMDVVRVYTKLPNKKEADMASPFTLKRGQTVLDLAERIHKDVAKNFKSARVWGSQVHDGSTVKGDYVISDRDIVELSN